MMARALGVGGIFFRSKNPAKLGGWYEQWLGIPVSPNNSASFEPADMPPRGLTVWAPFDEETSYFDPSKREFMFNLVVDDLDEALAQVQRGGAEVVGEIEVLDYGRFGWFLDPEGNKVELWQPKPMPKG